MSFYDILFSKGVQGWKVEEKVYIVAALGNPGREYERTRHNIGFLLAELAARSVPQGRWRAWGGLGQCFETRLGGSRVFFLKPETYMNNSGLAVRSLADFYKVPASGVIAVYDDMSLPFGKIKIRRGGSAGGHNGMLSIVAAMGTQELPRIKLGTGPRPAGIHAKDFVLGRFSKKEEAGLAPALERGFAALLAIFEKGLDEAMNRFNYDSDKPVP
ncbi:MAG: aminoacyl-tRNA hydrolase [Elusimicrobiales bacterium]|jgi:PTH1 family peptidyl-tRNA hydrolase